LSRFDLDRRIFIASDRRIDKIKRQHVTASVRGKEENRGVYNNGSSLDGNASWC
jgi:hypothetical protein